MKKDFNKKVLKNGMTVILEKRDLPIVSVSFAVRAGGINETEEEKGISHFIEHMLYKGTEKRSWKDIASEIEKNGGELNGFTDEEITAYVCKMPSKHLDIALDVLSDIVRNPKFDEKEMDKERKVIFEEMKMRKDRPNVYVLDETVNKLYGGSLEFSLIGTPKTMNVIDHEKIKKKFKELYTPNNMILCVVGDADFDELVKFAEENFGNEKSEIPEQKIDLKNGEKIETRKGIDQANLVFSYHIPLPNEDKHHAATLLNSLMAGGLSSRLFLEIREKRNLAYSIHGGCESAKRFSYAIVTVGTKRENVDLVKNLILEEFEKVSKELDEKELKEIKEQLIGQYQISMEDSMSQMTNLLMSEVSGKAEDFYDFEKNVSEVKLKDVKEMASNVKKGYSFFALVPED